MFNEELVETISAFKLIRDIISLNFHKWDSIEEFKRLRATHTDICSFVFTKANYYRNLMQMNK